MLSVARPGAPAAVSGAAQAGPLVACPEARSWECGYEAEGRRSSGSRSRDERKRCSETQHMHGLLRSTCEGALSDRALLPVRRERAWLSFALRWVSWAAVGVALILVAGFVELSQELFDPEEKASRLLSTDATVLRAVAHLRRPWLNGVAMDLTALGSPVLVALFTVALGALLLVKADRRGATILVATSFASALLTSATKVLFERPRPEVVTRLVEVVGLSYPSGHSLASAAVYLTAAFVLARHVSTLPERALGVAFTAGIVLFIGASRVYLGVHYPSDVFGGILLGTAWALLMATVLRRLDRRRSVVRTARPPSTRVASVTEHSKVLP